MTIPTLKSVVKRVREARLATAGNKNKSPVIPAPHIPYVEFPVPTTYDIGLFMDKLKKLLDYNPKLTVSLHKLRTRYRVRVSEAI